MRIWVIHDSIDMSLRLLLVLTLLVARTALALDPGRHVNEFAHRSWGTREGAPTAARALAQTTDGFLWLGGRHGLVRFDGTTFQSLESLFPGSQLRFREIRSLFASPEGGLWIGYFKGGVSVLTAGKLAHFSAADGFPEGDVTGFAQDRRGRMWVASSGGLAWFQNDHWHKVAPDSNYPGLAAQAVFVDHQDALWVATEHHIAVLKSGSVKFELTDEPYNGTIMQFAESSDGTVWVVQTGRSVRPLQRPGEAVPFHGPTRSECEAEFPDTYQHEPRCQRPNNLEVFVGSDAILFDHDSGLWITTLGDGLRRAPYPAQLKREPIGEFSNAVEQFTNKDGLSADYVTDILEDREGNIWTSTRDGLDQFRDSELSAVTLGSNSASLSIAPADDGYIFVVDTGDHLFRLYNSQDVTPVTVAAMQDITGIYRDPQGSIWTIGAHNGFICRLVEIECIDRTPLPAPTPVPFQARFAFDTRMRLWTYSGALLVRENGQWRRVPSSLSAQAGPVPSTEFSDASGQIWFGFDSGELLTVKDGQVQTYSTDVGKVESIYTRGAHLWVGGELGLASLDGSHFVAVVPSDLRAFDSVMGVVEADDGGLWLNEFRGIVHITADEVQRILATPGYRAHYDLLNSLDALPGNTAQGFFNLPKAIRGTDGRVWFTTSRGVAWADPRHPRRNELPPPVVIQAVIADGRQLTPAGRLEIPGATTNLQIGYTGLSLSVPERVQFRYRLKGFDHDWQDVGTRRTAYYTNLSPGSYDFQVIAANNSGVWNNVGASLTFRIVPTWYQTRWFYALCVLLVVAILTGLYRLRIAQVRHETRRLLDARVSERERIARDLHDTLLQGFMGLMYRLQAVRQLMPERPGDAQKTLDSALEAADQAISEARDAVQSLRSPTADEPDLATALGMLGTELAAELPEESRPQYRVVVEGRPRELAADTYENAYRIAREAVRNAYQHAKARRIETELTFSDSDLYIRVRDDGIGVDTEILARGQRSGHWGLPGMRERSESLGGHFHVWSQAKAGTEVELRIPARVAYARSIP